MPIIQDFVLADNEDGTLTVSMIPPVGIAGWSIVFQQTGRPFGYPSITKSMASGYYGVSGMNIINSGEGVMQVFLYAAESSGMQLIRANWAYNITRTDSGAMTILCEGVRLMNP